MSVNDLGTISAWFHPGQIYLSLSLSAASNQECSEQNAEEE